MTITYRLWLPLQLIMQTHYTFVYFFILNNITIEICAMRFIPIPELAFR